MKRTTVVLAVGMAVLLGTARISNGQILIDDFDDGNDEGWMRIDQLDMGGGPGIYDASSGAYNIRSTSLVPPIDGSNSLFSQWEASSSDPTYSNGLVRAKVQIDEDGTDGTLAMRISDVDFDGYYFTVSSFFSPPLTFMFKLADGELTIFEPEFQLPSGKDWMVEAGVVGNQLSMKTWRDGDPEPTTPQLMAIDPAPLPDGSLGVGSFVGGAHTSSFPIDATFDDIYFTPIPEPSTFALAALAFLAVLATKWRPSES